MNLFDEFQWRGMIYDTTAGLREVLANEKVTAYIGFDPSAPSLHVGSLLPMMALARLQHHGHTPIAVIGGGTGLIGDPSGKDEERPLLTEEEVESNAERIKEQLSRVLHVELKRNPAVIVNNAEWLTSICMIDFLRDVGDCFAVNYMLSKESVKGRLAEGKGLSFRAFSYMLLQAYDFVVLYDRLGCKLQMGGSDQWGNITAGIDLVRRLRAVRVHGLVFPLLTTAAGDKFGKTERGTVWLDAELTSPFQFYQFWLNTDDQDVITYLKYFTWLSEGEIQELQESVTNAPEKREAQTTLARETTRMVHGETALTRAERASRLLFHEEISELPAKDFLDIVDDVPSSHVTKSHFEGRGMSMVELLVRCGLASGKGDARRLIQQRAIYLNNRGLRDVQQTISLSDSIGGEVLILRKGKKEHHLVIVSGVEP